jgi:hypothetical protein
MICMGAKPFPFGVCTEIMEVTTMGDEEEDEATALTTQRCKGGQGAEEARSSLAGAREEDAREISRIASLTAYR